MSTQVQQSGAIPPLGITIPTFNGSYVLLRCFEHLEAQTWKLSRLQ